MGQPTAPLRIAQDDARGLLRTVAHDEAQGQGQVVWTSSAGELLVFVGALDLACAPGLVTVTVPVACDQVPSGTIIAVPFGVGRPGQVTGLVMSTIDRPTGPDPVVDAWAPSLTAYGWGALLGVAVRVSARAGAGLVPASIGADEAALLILPTPNQPLPVLVPPARAVRAVARIPGGIR